MVRITPALLRKRAEHNDGLIHNLEELTLHQDNLEEIENLDQMCRNLKILYLQGNAIPKIENLHRMKYLEYLNLALNNVETIENLHRCESLRKLDLTANFIGDLISVENLKDNCFLEELYLTGNPCCDYDGYREFVVGTLSQLKVLDGVPVTRTERLTAVKDLMEIKAKIILQQRDYQKSRSVQRSANAKVLGSGDEGEWEKMSWSPEYRKKMVRHREELGREKSAKKRESKKEEGTKLSLFGKSGEPLNINQLKIDFRLSEDDPQETFIDIPVYRYLDTSLIDLKIEPTYVRVVIKEKVLQLRLSREVSPDKASVQRSTTTGVLHLKLPLVTPILKKPSSFAVTCDEPAKESSSTPAEKTEEPIKLEVDPNVRKSVDLRVTGGSQKTLYVDRRSIPLGRANSPGFLDDMEVPPLE